MITHTSIKNIYFKVWYEIVQINIYKRIIKISEV